MVADMAAGRVIGVDLGGTKLLAGTVDSSLNVHHRAHRFARGTGTAEVLDTIVDAVREARDAAEGEVDAVGFGIPSLIDQERGVAVTTVHLPIRDLPFRDLMAERLGVPVFVENDATAAMLAEWRFGAARGCSDALLITVGTGIGGGMVAGGALVRGAQGAAAEFGHMTIDYDGPLCPCGAHGCLEAFVSGTALAREARALGLEMTAAQVAELAHDGHVGARALVAEMGTRLGTGIANLVNAFNPQLVVLGGGVLALGDLLLEPAREEVARRALAPSRDLVQIVPTRFGAESGMLGAAVLALEGVTAYPRDRWRDAGGRP
jgi:glucokinase